ncbi:IscS subfamily cysteine desulfurase [Alkalihalobacillus sp. AL-G]|uniref:IscS subfamily cysteine desulfurase n=1 Tax=Alkalihalobacillus sp. AL-G TaxID=2926399 RepID=UPI00272C4520|nr:IscS subfamily cysteine desulfurase [Alkalihalobacillus sp. AL-G]WLD94272.1 IscS subfamily cysteine desulfurase [Alkalihalobacillus sp. AL-G]
MIYLDYAATTPISKSALHVYTEVALNYFGNTESLHDIGDNARNILSESRRQLAEYMNGHQEGIYFTSGGSESNHLAITSIVRANKSRGNHLITTITEHASVLNTFDLLENEGFRVTKLPVDSYGQVSVEDLRQVIETDTILVSIGHANSEIGTLQPLQEVGQLLKENGIFFHSDCVQTFGKKPIDVQKHGLDSISISAHKVYGPKGVGACYISPNISWKSNLPGSTHEKGFRAGTVNVPGIAAFVTAVGELIKSMEQNKLRFKEIRESFLKIVDGQSNLVVEGHPSEHLPSILGIRTKGIEGQFIMLEMNRRGFSISTGSACSVGSQKPSKTMLAVGRNDDEARELIRLSFGTPTSLDDVEAAANALTEIYQKVRNSPVK